MNQEEWNKLTKEEKNKELFLKQVSLLKQFLHSGAINQEQFEKSYGDLKKLTGFDDEEKLQLK